MSPQYVTRDIRGAAMVEYAFAIPFMLFVLLVGLDLVRVAFNYVSLQYVVERGIRHAVIASHTGTDVQTFVINQARPFGLALQNSNLGLCPVGLAPCYNTANPGEPDDLLTLQISVPVDGFIIGSNGLLSRLNLNLVAQAQAQREYPA